MDGKAGQDGFPQFSLLPPEIRIQIWELCLPRRIIRVGDILTAHTNATRATYRYDDYDEDDDDNRAGTNTNTNTNTNPGPGRRLLLPGQAGSHLARTLSRPCAVAHVCGEARAVAARLRTPAAALGMPWLGPAAWFDPRTDTLLLDSEGAALYCAVCPEGRRLLLGCRLRRGAPRAAVAVAGSILPGDPSEAASLVGGGRTDVGVGGGGGGTPGWRARCFLALWRVLCRGGEDAVGGGTRLGVPGDCGEGVPVVMRTMQICVVGALSFSSFVRFLSSPSFPGRLLCFVLPQPPLNPARTRPHRSNFAP